MQEAARCFKLRTIHRDMTSRAKITVHAWNPDSPEWILTDGGTDTRTFNNGNKLEAAVPLI